MDAPNHRMGILSIALEAKSAGRRSSKSNIDQIKRKFPQVAILEGWFYKLYQVNFEEDGKEISGYLQWRKATNITREENENYTAIDSKATEIDISQDEKFFTNL